MKIHLTTNPEIDQLKTEEIEVTRIQDTTMNDANQDEDQEIEEPHEPIDPPQEKNPHNRRPVSVREAI